MAYPIIEILKYTRNKGVETETSTKLFYSPETHGLELQASDQRFFSKLSYYDYNRTERRWTRNMNHLFPLIKDLKDCGLWQYITNKGLLVINEHSTHPRLSAEKRRKILDIITGED